MCFIAATLLAKVSTVGVHKSLMFQGQFCLFLTEILENSCNCENISLIYHRMDDWKNKVLSSFVIKGRFQWWLDISLLFWGRVSKSVIWSLNTILSALSCTLFICLISAFSIPCTKTSIFMDSNWTVILLLH